MSAAKNTLPDPIVAAERLLTKLGSKEPPVNLSEVVSLWPNLFLTESELDGSGYLLPIGELGAEIIVNRSDAEERKRFTVAHELGHWVLGLTLQKKYGHFSQPKNAHYAEIERWCDKFATNLLMPESMIRNTITLADSNALVERLMQATTLFKVSDSAIFIRVWELLRIQVAWISLKQVQGRNIAFLDKSFAGADIAAALSNTLKLSHIVNLIVCSPLMIHTSTSAVDGKLEFYGRRIGLDRVFLAVKWP